MFAPFQLILLPIPICIGIIGMAIACLNGSAISLSTLSHSGGMRLDSGPLSGVITYAHRVRSLFQYEIGFAPWTSSPALSTTDRKPVQLCFVMVIMKLILFKPIWARCGHWLVARVTAQVMDVISINSIRSDCVWIPACCGFTD